MMRCPDVAGEKTRAFPFLVEDFPPNQFRPILDTIIFCPGTSELLRHNLTSQNVL